MVMRLLEVPIVDRVEYKKNLESQLRLPRNDLIRRMITHFVIKVNAGATAPTHSTLKNNGVLNVIKKMRLEIGASNNKFAIDGVMCYFKDWFETGVKPFVSTVGSLSANGSATYHIWFIRDFALTRSRLSDFRALLNAPANGRNDFYVEWGDTTDIWGTPGTAEIDADESYCEVSLLEAFDDGSGPEQLQTVLDNIIDIREGVDQYDIRQAYTSYDDSVFRVGVNPPKSLIYAHLIAALKNTTDNDPSMNDSDVITDVKLVNTLGAGETILQNKWEHVKRANKADFRLVNIPTGIVYFDWLDQRQRGIINRNADDLEWRMLTKPLENSKLNALRILTKYVPTS